MKGKDQLGLVEHWSSLGFLGGVRNQEHKNDLVGGSVLREGLNDKGIFYWWKTYLEWFKKKTKLTEENLQKGSHDTECLSPVSVDGRQGIYLVVLLANIS